MTRIMLIFFLLSLVAPLEAQQLEKEMFFFDSAKHSHMRVIALVKGDDAGFTFKVDNVRIKFIVRNYKNNEKRVFYFYNKGLLKKLERVGKEDLFYQICRKYLQLRKYKKEDIKQNSFKKDSKPFQQYPVALCINHEKGGGK